jgi:ribosomal RNA-processing protein 12
MSLLPCNLVFQSLHEISTLLSSLTRLSNPFLSQSAYSILSDVFSATTKDDDFNVVLEIPQILKALLSYPPEIDNAIAPVWLGLLGNGFLAYKNGNPQTSAGELGDVWKAVWAFLESSDVTIKKASCQSLALLAQCWTPENIAFAMQERDQSEPRSALGRVVIEAVKAFESLAFARSMSELLLVISALISNLRYRDIPTGPTAAEVLLLPLVQKIGNMRTEKNFEHKGAADQVLSQAMGTMGPAVLLGALPLNLEPADRSVHPQLDIQVSFTHPCVRQAGREPRAFLLPLLAQPHPSPLRHFVSYFVPLSERMFNLQQIAESESRQSEVKLWTVLIAQIWAGLSGYCWSKADTQEVAKPLLSQTLFTSILIISHLHRLLLLHSRRCFHRYCIPKWNCGPSS